MFPFNSPDYVRSPNKQRAVIGSMRAKAALLFTISFLLITREGFAIGQTKLVETTNSPGSFRIVEMNDAATIYVDSNDLPGVIRAAGDLQTDVSRVTGITPPITHDTKSKSKNLIIVGTIGRSAVIDKLIRDKTIDVSQVAGKWESYLVQVVAKPMRGVESALVIAGSDKRGTIYGIYDLSEQMGVSPWYWWADVPVEHKDALYVRASKHVEGPPAVQYRGIFINDEAPALTGLVTEKFGGYNHSFYTNVFELLLRLKANYLWPAMWNNCFNQDDPLNPKLADEYGIVMGTSHVEPMMRADKEWNRKGYSAAQWNYEKSPEELRAFWKEGIERNKSYENMITIAMRGKIDTAMSETANIALLEEIVAAQRKLIEEVYHTNAAAVPQDWALYKEVQEYYEKGMRVPDDVTLLWCDDNWGNIRRLPTAEESKRSGGAGVYYHFDYVGGPRNYKWLNTVPIAKIWEQMNLAHHYNANKIWIVNVGDIKPVEFPTEFFLTMARSPDEWPKERIAEFTKLWAEREFGPQYATDIADIVAKYTKYNGMRKPELLDPTTFSLLNYQEADNVTAEWNAIVEKAEVVSAKLPENARDAFFQLVLYPTKACAIVTELYIAAAKNKLHASQGRASANDYAAQVKALFKADQDLSDYYNHTMAGGKWNHMMDQTHIGYTYWQQPPKNNMPKVTEIDLPATSEMGIAIEGSASVWPGATNEAALPTFDSFNRPRHYIDVFNKGSEPFEFHAAASEPWIVLSTAQGRIEKEQRVWVSVDWNKAPKGDAAGFVKIAQGDAEPVAIKMNVFNPEEPVRDSVQGFVEADGHVSIEAVHYSRKVDAGNVRWEKIDDLGRTLSSMSIFPVTALSATPPQNSPHLEYQMYLFNAGKVDVETYIAPSLNFSPNRGVQFAVSFDDQAPEIVTAVPKGYFVDNGVRDWEESVKDNIRIVKSTHTLDKPGAHTLKIWMVDPGVVVQKFVVNTGGVKPSYLGPPESFHNGLASSAGDN